MDEPVAIRTTLAGPWGPVHVAATERGIVAVEWLTTEAAFDAAVARRLGGRVIESGSGRSPGRRERHLSGGIKAIETFLDGRQPKSDVPIDLADRPAWDRRVLGSSLRSRGVGPRATARSPAGSARHGQLARWAERWGATRSRS